jgi:hypothetical protein
MKLLWVLGLLILLSGCITINFNRGSRPADDKYNGTRQQNSGDDADEGCDEQIQSAAQLAAYPRSMVRPSMAAMGRMSSEDQGDNCLEDQTELPRKHFRTNQPVRRSRPRNRTSISDLAPAENAHGRQTLRTHL